MIPPPIGDEPLELLTLPEVAEYLGVSQSTLYRARDARELPPGIMLGGRMRWRKALIAEWVAAHEAQNSVSQTYEEEGML